MCVGQPAKSPKPSGVPPGGDVEHSPARNKNSGDVKSSFQRSAQNNGAARRKTVFFCYLPLPAKLKLRVYSRGAQGPSCHLDKASSLRAVGLSGLHMLDKHVIWWLESSLDHFFLSGGTVQECHLCPRWLSGAGL